MRAVALARRAADDAAIDEVGPGRPDDAFDLQARLRRNRVEVGIRGVAPVRFIAAAMSFASCRASDGTSTEMNRSICCTRASKSAASVKPASWARRRVKSLRPARTV